MNKAGNIESSTMKAGAILWAAAGVISIVCLGFDLNLHNSQHRVPVADSGLLRQSYAMSEQKLLSMRAGTAARVEDDFDLQQYINAAPVGYDKPYRVQ